MADFNTLRDAIQQFSFASEPAYGDNSAPATVGDIRKVVSNLSILLNAFVDELEAK